MTFVAVVELFEQCLAEHPFAFAMNENYFLALVADVFIHHAPEFVNLQVEHIRVAQAANVVNKLMNVEVHFYYIAIKL